MMALVTVVRVTSESSLNHYHWQCHRQCLSACQRGMSANNSLCHTEPAAPHKLENPNLDRAPLSFTATCTTLGPTVTGAQGGFVAAPKARPVRSEGSQTIACVTQRQDLRK